MSGTTIAYGDRPIANVPPGGTGAYATFEFLQYLERLSRAHSTNSADVSLLQPQITANANAIASLSSAVSTLGTQAATGAANDAGMLNQITILSGQVPAQTSVVHAGAIALTSGAVTQIATQSVLAGGYVITGTIYLTGSGTVTLAQASAGLTAGVIEPAPGAFATGWFGGGAAPGTLGVDLSVGSFSQLISVTVPGTAYLNVQATFSGAISAYGNLIVWRAMNAF